MDYSQKDFLNKKKEIELSLARTILTQVEKRAITFDKAREMARFIVDRLEGLTTPKKLADFLSDLSEKWNVFGTLYEFYKMRLEEEKELSNFIKHKGKSLASL